MKSQRRISDFVPRTDFFFIEKQFYELSMKNVLERRKKIDRNALFQLSKDFILFYPCTENNSLEWLLLQIYLQSANTDWLKVQKKTVVKMILTLNTLNGDINQFKERTHCTCKHGCVVETFMVKKWKTLSITSRMAWVQGRWKKEMVADTYWIRKKKLKVPRSIFASLLSYSGISLFTWTFFERYDALLLSKMSKTFETETPIISIASIIIGWHLKCTWISRVD